MRLSVYFSALILVLSATAQAQTAQTLTGKMAAYNYLMGGPWTCKTTMTGAPAGVPPTSTATVTFDAVSPSTMHVRVAAPPFVSDSYYGYATQPSMYWSTTADSMGTVSSERSTDGKTYSGTAMVGPASAQVQDVYTKVSDTHSTVHSTMMVNGKQQVSDSDCTR